MNSVNDPKPSSRSGLSVRVAARAGFSDLMIETAQIRSRTVSSSEKTGVPSPLLTIPPGLSPTMLLDSPFLASKSVAEPSPITSKFPFTEGDNDMESVLANENNDHPLQQTGPPSFALKHPLGYSSGAENNPALHMNGIHLQHGFSQPYEENGNFRSEMLDKRASKLTLDESQDEIGSKGEHSSTSLGAPAEDGYNWRKYGQKQVKGSEYPRSYFKCTHPNCPVKKKVERSQEGLITEIIYKGVHSHPKPALNRELSGAATADSKNDATDADQSASIAVEQCDQSNNNMQDQEGLCREAPDGLGASSTLSNDDDADELATLRSVSLGGDDDCDGDGGETESKRRKLVACALEISSASKAAREPRVVVQTTSDVDILDDGYRWRKYGQKVVKGNPNPRSYYKCTNPKCTVRKHVERASHDLKSVITSYEGKHNHDVPAARTSNQTSSTSLSTSTNTSAPPTILLQQNAELARMADSSPLLSYGVPSRDQPLGVIPLAGLGNIPTMKMPVLPPFPAYMAQHHQNRGTGFMMPNGRPKEEPSSDPTTQLAVHQLFINQR
ncbi:putative WRKY transcription factor 2 [Apostasia shenzhenica]|uniref:Putative WRKY transcription factor 2 n=1 Tax=Apostasia shenzhenica TaxID=1088818 RepID=A0A2I0B3P3_9ASPA|nr:putative WRKY transcription factor 2 [Apostasia shenzhenica]